MNSGVAGVGGRIFFGTLGIPYYTIYMYIISYQVIIWFTINSKTIEHRLKILVHKFNLIGRNQYFNSAKLKKSL